MPPLAEPRTHAGGTASHRLAESVLESLPQQAGWPAPELGGTGHAASPHGAAARGSLAATPQLPEPTARPGPDLPAPRVKRHAEHTEFLPPELGPQGRSTGLGTRPPSTPGSLGWGTLAPKGILAWLFRTARAFRPLHPVGLK